MHTYKISPFRLWSGDFIFRTEILFPILGDDTMVIAVGRITFLEGAGVYQTPIVETGGARAETLRVICHATGDNVFSFFCSHG